MKKTVLVNGRRVNLEEHLANTKVPNVVELQETPKELIETLKEVEKVKVPAKEKKKKESKANSL